MSQHLSIEIHGSAKKQSHITLVVIFVILLFYILIFKNIYAIAMHFIPILVNSDEQVSVMESSVTSTPSPYRKISLTLNKQKFIADIADTEDLRDQGLSDREILGANEAMLFVFNKADRYGFWMKDMNFPLDIIWTDDQGRIVYYYQNLSPDTYPQVYYPSATSTMVVEVNAGIIEKQKVKIGDQLIFDKNILKKASN